MALTLREVAAASRDVAATPAKRAKIARLAELFRAADDRELPAVTALLAGTPRQGRIGVGWALLSAAAAAIDLDATGPSTAGGTLTVLQLDQLLDELIPLTGGGSVAVRTTRLATFLRHADGSEADLVRQLLLGGLRQGALEGLVLEAVAAATSTPAAAVRRALMLAGDLGVVAAAARAGGSEALAAVRLEVGRPLRPMLAATSPTVAAAVSDLGEVSVEWKLDGARVQVHRRGEVVTIFTRNLNDVTARLPEVAETVRALPVDAVVLDGELIGLSEDTADQLSAPGTPRLFQDTISRFATRQLADLPAELPAPDGASLGAVLLSPFFFDCLHLDGEDLVDAPLRERLDALDRAVGRLSVPRLLTSDAPAAEAFAADTIERGHEGVMVKSLGAPYAAGRRGATWRKVKPVHTLDLVVLAAEWGHGRRRGWLSNLHLGARDPAHTDQYVMVGKTFKGLTDALLTWQTEQLLARQIETSGITVRVRPELVVEIALDGVQRSVRYPGGVALRFARVRRYRADKRPVEADTIDTLRAMLPRS
jgi:DNA ligase-1